MNGLHSPDIPAYLSYALVLVVGSLVALSSVNKLLAEQRDRWAYAATWLLFVAYALLPVVLFWFLDYNSVISDTSLFSAMVTAVAYQQIFAGGVEGIRLPGQTAAVWRAFEAWVTRIQQHIDSLNQARNVRFTERMLGWIAAQDSRIAKLEELVRLRSTARQVLDDDLRKLSEQPEKQSADARNRVLVKRLWDDLRRSERDNYGQLLANLGLMDSWTYWVNFRNGRSILMSVAVIVVVLAAGFFGYRGSRPSHGDYWLAYQQWRFVRNSPTAADEFRSRRELLIALKGREKGAGIAETLADELIHRDVLVDTAQRILDFLLFAHSPAVTPRIVQPLIEALRTPNPDVRLRIHRTLKDLQTVQFAKTPLTGDFESIGKWVPAKEDSAGAIDGHIQTWVRWWEAATAPPPAPTPPEKALSESGRFTASNVLFDSGLATLRSDALGVLRQVADALASHPDWVILIEGHTDDVGEDAYNLALSEKRASAVVDYLKSISIDESRLTAVGKGERQPLIREATEEARRKNRRVVFKRIDEDAPTDTQRR